MDSCRYSILCDDYLRPDLHWNGMPIRRVLEHTTVDLFHDLLYLHPFDDLHGLLRVNPGCHLGLSQSNGLHLRVDDHHLPDCVLLARHQQPVSVQ